VKIGDFPLVETLVTARGQLVHLKDQGKIVIEGARMVHEFVETVRPAIKLELRHRIDQIDQQLRGLGVVIDEGTLK
jgi:hypothetical protein